MQLYNGYTKLIKEYNFVFIYIFLIEVKMFMLFKLNLACLKLVLRRTINKF